MRIGSWLLGMAAGAIIGGAMFAISVPALVLLVPAFWWSTRERSRPSGLGGVLVGLGGGMAGLMWFASARCAASNVSGVGYVSTCEVWDITPYLLVAAALILIGGVSLLALVRTRATRG
jgi:hypothetical protein